MGKTKEMQLIIKQYKDMTGETQVDMHKVAKFATDMGWPLSQPEDPLDRLAQSFTRAARAGDQKRQGHKQAVSSTITQFRIQPGSIRFGSTSMKLQESKCTSLW